MCFGSWPLASPRRRRYPVSYTHLKVLTHNYIMKEIWGNTLPSDTPSLRVFMATLRKKVETDPSRPRYIQTHIGVGYRMIRMQEEGPGD